jgi:hypothetical protein
MGVRAACVWAAALWAAVAGPPERPASAGPPPLPDAENFPPLPPTWPGFEEILGQVFQRFPGVNQAQVLGFLREQYPRQMRDIEAVARYRMKEAIETLTELVREGLDLFDLRQKDPDLFAKVVRQRELEREASLAAEALARSAGEARKKHLDRLRQTLQEAFDAKQDLMRGDVSRMERELEQLKALIEKRRANRDAIVARRLSEITGELAGTEW